MQESECLFMDVFAEVLNSQSENLPRCNVHNISIDVPPINVSPAKVCLSLFWFVTKKHTKKLLFVCCSLVIPTVFQGPEKVNLALPGSLMPFKKDIAAIFIVEKASFLSKKHFANVFADLEIQPVYLNRANLEKLVVRTKIA